MEFWPAGRAVEVGEDEKDEFEDPEEELTETQETKYVPMPAVTRSRRSLTKLERGALLIVAVGLLVSLLLDLSDPASQQQDGILAGGFTAMLGSFVSIGQVAGFVERPACRDCSHLQSGIDEAIEFCTRNGSDDADDLIRRFTIKVTTLSESLAVAQAKAAAAEARQREAEGKIKAAEAARKAAERSEHDMRRLLASKDAASKSEINALAHTARWGSGCDKSQAELRLAKLGAAEAARKQRRLTAKLQVVETEIGLLLAERSLAQAQQTVAEEVAVAAVAACGDNTPAVVEEVRRESGSSKTQAPVAEILAARRALERSVKAAEEVFESTAPRDTARGGRMWDSRIDLAFGQTDKFADLPVRGMDRVFLTKSLQADQRTAASVFGGWLGRALWRGRFAIVLLTAITIFVARVGNEEVGPAPKQSSLKVAARAKGKLSPLGRALAPGNVATAILPPLSGSRSRHEQLQQIAREASEAGGEEGVEEEDEEGQPQQQPTREPHRGAARGGGGGGAPTSSRGRFPPREADDEDDEDELPPPRGSRGPPPPYDGRRAASRGRGPLPEEEEEEEEEEEDDDDGGGTEILPASRVGAKAASLLRRA